MLSKPYFHPAIIAVLRETYFTGIRGASLGTKYHRFFKSSIPEHATELELPVAMLALVATAVGARFLASFTIVIYYFTDSFVPR